MKKKLNILNLIFKCIVLMSMLISSCNKDKNPESIEEPVVATISTELYSDTLDRNFGCAVYSYLDDDGGSPIINAGVCWSDTGIPTIKDSKVTQTNIEKRFICAINGKNHLLPCKRYFLRSFATNKAGTGYGNVLELTTSGFSPLFEIDSLVDLTDVSASLHVKIISNGGYTIEKKGICWSISSIPNLNDNETLVSTGDDNFNVVLSELKSGTTYYCRPYAINSAGVGYGKTMQFTTIGDVTDIDGNIYHSLRIGNCIWMTENLKVTHYTDGQPIPNDKYTSNLPSEGGYCDFNNNPDNSITYGRLYSNHALHNSKLFPTGWRLSTEQDWDKLIQFLGGENIAGSKIKETSLAHWLSPNKGATNSTGFTAIPGGYRKDTVFLELGESANFASSDHHEWFEPLGRGEYYKLCYKVDYDHEGILKNILYNEGKSQFYFSVRLTRDVQRKID